jgi:hypothetical protein
VPVVDIWVVGVPMDQPPMLMGMCMRLPCQIDRAVGVLVMFVMGVPMCVQLGLVRVLVQVPLAEV